MKAGGEFGVAASKGVWMPGFPFCTKSVFAVLCGTDGQDAAPGLVTGMRVILLACASLQLPLADVCSRMSCISTAVAGM